MCQSCVEIDKRVERYRQLLRSTTDAAEVERIDLFNLKTANALGLHVPLYLQQVADGVME